MKIIQAEGQTCNQFWIYAHYFVEAIQNDEKILILAPDIGFKNYPNLNRQNFVSFPLYNEYIIKKISYSKYIHFLNKVFNNKFSKIVLTNFFKVIPNVSYKEAKMGRYTNNDLTTRKLELKKIFEPTRDVMKKGDLFFKQKKMVYDKIIGIHIRRGDYRTWKNGKFFYTDKEYHLIMNQIEKLFPNQNVGFLICSNEKIDLNQFDGSSAFILNESSASLDLYGLSLCDYILGPPSSYSSWASFYGDVPLYFISNKADIITLDSFFHQPLLWPPLV